MTQDRANGLRHFKVGCLYQNTYLNEHGYEFYAQASLKTVVRVIPHTPLLCLGSVKFHNGDNNVHAVFIVETAEQLPAEIVLQDNIEAFQFYRELT